MQAALHSRNAYAQDLRDIIVGEVLDITEKDLAALSTAFIRSDEIA